MRKLRMCYSVGYCVFVVTIALIFSSVVAHRLEQVQPAAKTDKLEVISYELADVPVSGLSDSLDMLLQEKTAIVVPIQKQKLLQKASPTKNFSDGKFEKLSEPWKLGVRQVVGDKRCRRVAQAFKVGTVLNPLIREARAIVESNCNPVVMGDAGEIGLFQPKPETCKELGVTGDLRDPEVNAACTEAHDIQVCREVGEACTELFITFAHNRGARGALRVEDPLSTTYMRRIGYAIKILQGI